MQAFKLNDNDTVAIAKEKLLLGAQPFEGIEIRDTIPSGHKFALVEHAKGQQVLRYGQVIGLAKRKIQVGEHVHEHNLEIGDVLKNYGYGKDARPTELRQEIPNFQGIIRRNGQVGTRNYIGILTSVNCSAHVANMVARVFEKNPFTGENPLREFPNVDGVVALTHQTGCGMSSGEPLQILRRTLSGYARHPNFSHILILGLGCEVNQIDGLVRDEGLDESIMTMNIQSMGGAQKTVHAAINHIHNILPESNSVRRQPVPASELKVALICGGSDGYSGISANPALGAASDLVVACGGTVILSETPETYGAEHLLTRRAVSQEVGEKLVARMKWWEEYTSKQDVSMNSNPSPGNKRGGLTTILEKSLGALTKGGSTNLVEVVEYAENVTQKGLVFMDAPGYDPVQVTGQIAGGANIVAFTTGRGSVFGSKPVPTAKLATNSTMYNHMSDDMDINCGTIIDGEESLQECGQRIFEYLLRVASGEESASERQDFGASEFAPWILGAVI